MKDKLQDLWLALKVKLYEAIRSVLPIAAIVVVLCFTIAPVPVSMFLGFIIGAVLLVLGMALFSLGADTAVTPIGERIGVTVTKSGNVWLTLCVGLIIGVLITVSEPDLQVLADQVPAVPNLILILSIAVGVGIFLVIALLRILFSISLRVILLALYTIVFALAIFSPGDFLAVAFDSGGVTTGPMTVPFIMAFGVGVSALRSDKHAAIDSFGMVALCSVGPILTTLILGLIYHPGGTDYTPFLAQSVENSRDMWGLFTDPTTGFMNYLKEVSLALGPVVLMFIVFQLVWLHLHKRLTAKIALGFGYTFLGLVLFLTGVNVGFMPLGGYVGELLGSLAPPRQWVILPIGLLIGYFIVAAEPAVHVLNKQVEEVSSGAIPAKAMQVSLSIGVSISVGLSMLRLLLGIPIIWFLVPGYALALGLSFFVPKIFTAIAFDSGGVASGPMTATFLLPFAVGICGALGGNIVTDAFGVVAMVAMTPLITIQILGLITRIRGKQEAELEVYVDLVDEEILEE
ncbi:MAG: DUF1538 domain-containing protein [Oscillospiraceae bacterium]|nr:DUF1538 domain-containing protein [Oscillospiraceae bacterium]